MVKTVSSLELDNIPHNSKEYFRVAVGKDAFAQLNLSVTVLRGGSSGLKVLILGGQHGDEYFGMLGLTEFIQQMKPQDLIGEVWVVPCLNILGFERGHRVNAYDHQDMNRVHPGDSEGTLTERIVAFLHEELLPKADVVLDVHGGSTEVGDMAFGRWVEGSRSDEYDFTMEGLIECLGLDYIIQPEDTTGSSSGRMDDPSYFKAGEISIEACSPKASTKENISFIVGMLKKALIKLGMLEGQLCETVTPRLSEVVVQRAKVAGLLIPLVELGSDVSKGEDIAVIRDFEGLMIQRITAEVDGKLLVLRTGARTVPGEMITGIGVLS